MTLHELVRRSRRLVKSGIVVAAVIVVGVTIVRIVNLDHRGAGEVLGSIALGVALGLPVVFAWLSLDRRPTLLPAAALGGIVSALLSLGLMVLWVYPIYAWSRAWNERPRRTDAPLSRRLVRVGLAAVVAASFLVLFAHVDPICRQTLSNGTTVEVSAAERGFSSGWTFGLGSTSSRASSGELGGEVVAETCASDRIVVGEALASLAISGGAMAMASRWPQGAVVGSRESSSA